MLGPRRLARQRHRLLDLAKLRLHQRINRARNLPAGRREQPGRHPLTQRQSAGEHAPDRQSTLILAAGPWGGADIDAPIDASANELNQPRRLELMDKALMLAKEQRLFLPPHQQPMIWATRDAVSEVVQLPDNKARHWLTRMK